MEITELVNKEKPAGVYEIEFNSDNYNLSSGVYIVRMNAGSLTESKKLILIK